MAHNAMVSWILYNVNGFVGTVVGSVFGGIPNTKLGRKKVLLWIGILFSISAIGSALAQGPYMFSFFRFIGGLGIGVSSVAAQHIFQKFPSLKRGAGLAPCTSSILYLVF